MESGATAKLFAAQPQLQRVVTAGAAFDLAPRTLLHAGPPLHDPTQPPPVLMSSAVMTCLHEGWASDQAAACAMVRDGLVCLMPAQPLSCVTPLAHVISAGTPLFQVGDGVGRSVFAPVSTVGGPDTRMGHRDPTLLTRLADRDRRIAPAWQQALSANGALPLLPIAAIGLAHGDDLHSRTTAANGALVQWLRGCGMRADISSEIEAMPLYILTPWMAACALMLRAAEGQDSPTLLTRAGGNGERFGIALASAPSEWVCVDATAPTGPEVPGAVRVQVCGAIGDSAVIDIFGCGGQALSNAAEPLQTFVDFLPKDYIESATDALGPMHPQLMRPVLMGARCVVDAGRAPWIMLAKIAQDGLGGFVGRGIYRPPIDLFSRALQHTAAR
jgi:hypothetical protein